MDDTINGNSTEPIMLRDTFNFTIFLDNSKMEYLPSLKHSEVENYYQNPILFIYLMLTNFVTMYKSLFISKIFIDLKE